MKHLLAISLAAFTFAVFAQSAPADLDAYEVHVAAMATNLELEPCPDFDREEYTHCFLAGMNIHRLAATWPVFNHERATPHYSEQLTPWDTKPTHEYAEFRINNLAFSIYMNEEEHVLLKILD